jgi:hypothetical protein
VPNRYLRDLAALDRALSVRSMFVVVEVPTIVSLLRFMPISGHRSDTQARIHV